MYLIADIRQTIAIPLTSAPHTHFISLKHFFAKKFTRQSYPGARIFREKRTLEPPILREYRLVGPSTLQFDLYACNEHPLSKLGLVAAVSSVLAHAASQILPVNTSVE